jgi:hypothetical protein
MTMNAHSHLSMHLSRHVYKRGQYEGQAPADPSRRAYTTMRVIRNDYDSSYAVRFHHTDILTAYPDGRVVLRCNGWDSNPSTRQAMFLASSIAKLNPRINLCTHNGNGLRTTAFRGYAFYDGLTLDSNDPTLPQITPVRPLNKYVKDRDQTTLVRAEAKDFRGVLPVLHAARQTPPTHVDQLNAGRALYDPGRSRHPIRMALAVPELWPELVTKFWAPTPAKTWSAIYANITERMHIEVPV